MSREAEILAGILTCLNEIKGYLEKLVELMEKDLEYRGVGW